MMRVIISLNCK